MSKEHIRKIVDLPTVHLSGPDYVPAPTRDPEIRALRHGRRPGTITLEQQAEGIAKIPRILERLRTPEGMEFASRSLAIATFNSGWYMNGREAPVMRRVGHLPKLVDEETDWRQTPEGLRIANGWTAHDLAIHAGHLAVQHAERASSARQRTKIGRRLTDLSLSLTGLQVVDIAATGSAAEAQHQAWEASQDMVSLSRTLGREIGTNPSIASLADPDSDFSVYWRRNAPDDAYDALVESVA